MSDFKVGRTRVRFTIKTFLVSNAFYRFICLATWYTGTVVGLTTLARKEFFTVKLPQYSQQIISIVRLN